MTNPRVVSHADAIGDHCCIVNDEPYTDVRPYQPPAGAPEAILVDLDGTVALLNGRDPFDQTTCLNDLPNKPVIDVVRSLAADRDWSAVFMSGRPDSCRQDTLAWLCREVIRGGYPWAGDCAHWGLYMRGAGDTRPDWQTKLELFDKYVRDFYQIQVAFDDRDQVVKLWRQMGITTFQVADGSF